MEMHSGGNCDNDAKAIYLLRDFIPIVGCGILLQQRKAIRDHSYVGQSVITEKDS